MPSDSCLLEQMFFDIARNSLRLAIRFLGFPVAINIFRTETLQFRVWAPDVVPALELTTQLGQVVKVLDDRYPFEPFIFQGYDHSLRKRNRNVLSYGSQAWHYTLLLQRIGDALTCKDGALIRDYASGSSIEIGAPSLWYRRPWWQVV